MQSQEVEDDPFQTVTGVSSGGFMQQPQQMESDLTEEELQLINEVEQADYARMQMLQTKQESEMQNKRERKQSAENELATMKSDRKRLIAQHQETNQINEKDFFAHREEQRQGKNPWDRVVENCDFSTSSSAGGKDMSRMKQVMQARRADITKAGGMKAKETMNMF